MKRGLHAHTFLSDISSDSFCGVRGINGSEAENALADASDEAFVAELHRRARQSLDFTQQTEIDLIKAMHLHLKHTLASKGKPASGEQPPEDDKK